MIWPIHCFWRFTPLQWVCALLWNLSEVTGVPLPKPHRFFEIILGVKGVEK